MIIPETPAGHVRVLIEVEKHPKLAEAAQAFFDHESPSPSIEAFAREFRRRGLQIDPTFGALPVGPGSGASERSELSADLFRPKRSDKFVLRGFVDARIQEEGRGKIGEDVIIHSDPMIGGLLSPPHPTCGTSPAVGNTNTVRQKLGTRTLARHGLNGKGVAIAIVDSGIFLPRITQLLGDMKPGAAPRFDPIHSWKWNVVTEPGMHRLGHGTMCAYDALIAAPEATLIDVAMLIARAPGDHSVKGTVGAAMLAYAHLINMWVFGPRPNYRGLVISNSWGIFHPGLEDYPPTDTNRYIDNPNHIFRLYIQLLAQAGADIIFCGNNCGPTCASATCLSQTTRMITGANTYPEVLTITGCDTNDELVGYSSLGPSIAGMYQHKPDLTAYTHFLGSKARRIFLPDTGVSAACPVAAGCVAAIRTKKKPSQLPPAQLFDTLRNTARAGIDGGPGGIWNDKYGCGIIAPVAAARSLGLIP
jgi:hypothetical protein